MKKTLWILFILLTLIMTGCNKKDINGFYTEGKQVGINSETKTKFDKNGYDRFGYDKNGYNDLGFDSKGFDSKGFNSKGFDKYGYNKTGYDKNGYDKNGLDKNKYNSKGFNSKGDFDGKTRDFDATLSFNYYNILDPFGKKIGEKMHIIAIKNRYSKNTILVSLSPIADYKYLFSIFKGDDKKGIPYSTNYYLIVKYRGEIVYKKAYTGYSNPNKDILYLLNKYDKIDIELYEEGDKNNSYQGQVSKIENLVTKPLLKNLKKLED